MYLFYSFFIFPLFSFEFIKQVILDVLILIFQDGIWTLICFVIISLITALFLLLTHANPSTKPAMTTAANPIASLDVSLTPGPASQPPSITAHVKNTASHPITILIYDSPLDPIALQRGLLQITPRGASQPLDLPEVQVRRLWPPSKDELVTLEAGETATNEVPLR